MSDLLPCPNCERLLAWKKRRDKRVMELKEHLATETAAIQKVRDEIKRNSECLWARHKDTTHCDAERALAFGQYDNSVWWLAALDEFLERRRK